MTNSENDEAAAVSGGDEPDDENDATEQEQGAKPKPPLPPEAYARFMRQIGGVTAFHEQIRRTIAPLIEQQQQIRRSLAPLLDQRRRIQQQLRYVVAPAVEFNLFREQMVQAVAPSLTPFLESQIRMREQVAGLLSTGALAAMERQRNQIRQAFEGFARAALYIFPENLRGIEGLGFEEVSTVVMDDGIPLYAVPRSAIAKTLIRDETTQKRRAILGRRWGAIATDCRAALEGCDAEYLEQERRFALDALAALEAGHTAAAQALAASLLDTMIWTHLDQERVLLVPGRKVRTPEGYEEFFIRKYWALAPIWSAYQNFFPDRGDRVPRVFARHASAHAVSPAQFSRRNAVQATMLVTSLIVYLNDDHYRI